MLNLVMNGAILYPVKQVNNVSIATHGLNNNFILKYTSQPNATIFKTPVIVRVGPSVPLRILSVSKVDVFNIELVDIEIYMSVCNLNLYFKFVEETVSLESPPPEANNHNLGELLSQVLPEDEIRRNAAVAALAAAAEQKQLEMAAAGMSFQQRAPGSQLRNGSMTVK